MTVRGAHVREVFAGALDAQADRLDEILAELVDAEQLCEMRGRDQIVTEVRSLAGAPRAEASTIRGEARELRIVEAPPALPMAITTRHVRPAPTVELEEAGPA